MSPVAKDKLRADEFARRLGKSSRIPMGKIFALAKEFIDMPPAEIEKLLDNLKSSYKPISSCLHINLPLVGSVDSNNLQVSTK